MADVARGWRKVEMTGLSWLNMALGAVLLGVASLVGPPGAAFWSAFVVGGIVVVLEIFDEWAERNDLEQEVVGPESVIIVCGLWTVAFPLLASVGVLYAVVTVAIGALLTAAATFNLYAGLQLERA